MNQQETICQKSAWFLCNFINLKADSISSAQILADSFRWKKTQELIGLMGEIFRAFYISIFQICNILKMLNPEFIKL